MPWRYAVPRPMHVWFFFLKCGEPGCRRRYFRNLRRYEIHYFVAHRASMGRNLRKVRGEE